MRTMPLALMLTAAIGVASLSVATTSLAAEQTTPAATQPNGAFWQSKAERRLEMLKAQLNLQPIQEAAWNAYADNVKKQEVLKDEHRNMKMERANMNVVDRTKEKIKFEEQKLEQHKATEKSLETLYGQLTPAQQAIINQPHQEKMGKKKKGW